jgi:glutathione S-transferase
LSAPERRRTMPPSSSPRCVEMIELIQFPWSPFCLVQRHILRFSGVRFQIHNLKQTHDRSLVWKLTKERYYGVPIIRDGRNVIFETDENSQVIAKYLDQKLNLGLFPADLEGEQSLLWRYIENEIEGVTFKLNDVYFREFVARPDQLPFIRHKERKFGRGCLDEWRALQSSLQKQLAERLLPFEEMLTYRSYLLGDRPRFLDFDLLGMLENFLYTGHYKLPANCPQIARWYRRLKELKLEDAK